MNVCVSKSVQPSQLQRCSCNMRRCGAHDRASLRRRYIRLALHMPRAAALQWTCDPYDSLSTAWYLRGDSSSHRPGGV